MVDHNASTMDERNDNDDSSNHHNDHNETDYHIDDDKTSHHKANDEGSDNSGTTKDELADRSASHSEKDEVENAKSNDDNCKTGDRITGEPNQQRTR